MKPLQLLRSVLFRSSNDEPQERIQPDPGPARSPRFEAWIHAYRERLASDPQRGKWSSIGGDGISPGVSREQLQKKEAAASGPRSNSRANDAG